MIGLVVDDGGSSLLGCGWIGGLNIILEGWEGKGWVFFGWYFDDKYGWSNNVRVRILGSFFFLEYVIGSV